MFLGIILGTLWMIFIFHTMSQTKVPDRIFQKSPFLGKIFIAVMFIFIARVWFVTIFDVIDCVNAVFGLFGCEPIDPAHGV